METMTESNVYDNEEYFLGTPLCASEFFLSTCNSLTNCRKYKNWRVSILRDDLTLFTANKSSYDSKRFLRKLTKWTGGNINARSIGL
jgi:hypothetical protein